MARTSRRSNRGAILLNVAIGLMVFIGVTAFVVDYGVMWVGRGQAQNAADAGALAGAVAMAFDANGWTDRTPTGPARASALRMAQVHSIWGQPPNVDVNTDVFFTGLPAAMCPADANGRTPCIRVDVYRNQARGNPLPAIFGLRGRARQPGRACDRYRARGGGGRQRLPEAVGHPRQVGRQPRHRRTGRHVDAGRHLRNRSNSRVRPGPRSTRPTCIRRRRRTAPGTGFTVAADLGTDGDAQGGRSPGRRFRRVCTSRFGSPSTAGPAQVATTTATTSRTATVSRFRSAPCSRARTAT